MNYYVFLITSLIIAILPGTGVIYTISTGIMKGRKASIVASIGCTAGIIPHLITSIVLSSLLIKMNNKVFFILKIIGALYLLYLGCGMFFTKTTLDLNKTVTENKTSTIIYRAILINLLNPKLTLFFFSFLPQYISTNNQNYVNTSLLLGAEFMLITLIVFIAYGLLASLMKSLITKSQKLTQYITRAFGMIFIFFSINLAISSM